MQSYQQRPTLECRQSVGSMRQSMNLLIGDHPSKWARLQQRVRIRWQVCASIGSSHVDWVLPIYRVKSQKIYEPQSFMNLPTSER